jgi:hypothetical protein
MADPSFFQEDGGIGVRIAVREKGLCRGTDGDLEEVDVALREIDSGRLRARGLSR